MFLDKPIYKSLTAWGVVVLLTGEFVFRTACDHGLIPGSACFALGPILDKIGIAMTALGIRRAVK